MQLRLPTKLVFFDMDGVLFDVRGYDERTIKVAISTWNALFDHLGIYYEHKRLKEKFIKGDFRSYMEWTDEACQVLQSYGLKEETFMAVMNTRPLMAGAKETIQTLKEKGYWTAVITGSFGALAKRAQKLLGLDYAVAHCNLVFDQDGNLKTWDLIPCDYEGKVEYFHKLVAESNLSPAACAYIGDEVNDILIFQQAGLSIAFNCQKEEVKRVADIVVDSNDLRDTLPYLLGYMHAAC